MLPCTALTATYAAAELRPIKHAVPPPHEFAVVVAGNDSTNNWDAEPLAVAAAAAMNAKM